MQFTQNQHREWITRREKDDAKNEVVMNQRHDANSTKLDRIAEKFEAVDRLVTLLNSQYTDSKIYINKLGERVHKLEGTSHLRDQAILTTLDRIEEQMKEGKR